MYLIENYNSIISFNQIPAKVTTSEFEKHLKFYGVQLEKNLGTLQTELAVCSYEQKRNKYFWLNPHIAAVIVCIHYSHMLLRNDKYTIEV